MPAKKPRTPEELLRAVIRYLLSARATESDAAWLMGILPNDLKSFFRSEALSELDRKATRDGKVDCVKRRKIFYALSGVGRAIFGVGYEETKRRMDVESKAMQVAKE